MSDSERSAEIRLHIAGVHGTIDVGALHRALGALIELLRAGGITSNFVISDLREGSAEVALRARIPDEIVDARFEEIVQGLGQLSREHVDDSWDTAMLQSAAELSSALDLAGVEGVTVSVSTGIASEVTPATRSTAIAAIERSSVSIGSVTGRIHRFFDHKSRREFGLIDETTQHSITVTFTKADEPRVLRAVGSTVEAWGELRRNRDGRKVSLKLDDFRVLPRPPRIPTDDDIVGILGDWTGGESSVDAVRRNRDGE